MFTSAALNMKFAVQVLTLIVTFLISLSLPNPATFALAAPSPRPSNPAVDPASAMHLSSVNVPLSPKDTLAAYTGYGPFNKGQAEGLNAKSNGPPKWTGGNKEVIHLFNCQKRPNWGHGTDSLVVICDNPRDCLDLNYLPPDDSLCLMDRFEEDGVFHVWEGTVQACLFRNYNNELSWNVSKDAQNQRDYFDVGFLTSDTYVYQGFKDPSNRMGLDIPFRDCQSIYHFRLRKDLTLVHGDEIH